MTEEEWKVLGDDSANPKLVANVIVRALNNMLRLMMTRASGAPTSYCNLYGNQ